MLCRVLVLLVLILLLSPALSLAESPPIRNVIPSWGDMTLVHGPGTSPAMDSPETMRRMIRHWQARGFTGVYLRSDLLQFLPGSVIRHQQQTQAEAPLAVAWHIIDEIMARHDPHRIAGEAARELGFEYWIFHPYIYSEGAPVDVGVPGLGRMVPWSYMRRAHLDHPEVITVDRQGNKQWMVPEYAYPQARADKVAEFVHMARTYNPTGIIASMRSESSQLIPPPDHADQYGFNPPVVEEMKRLYDVDILTDPRFDWQSPQFKSDEPLLDKWRTLRGTYITRLYREIREALRKEAPQVKLAVSLSGDYVGPIMGNARLDWRTWVDEGLVDVLIAPAFFEATLDLEAGRKGYLTHVREGIGVIPAADIKDYIKRSPHPEIQVIQTGASSYFYDPPPPGADGWQCDAWYDAYHLAWYQRWQQWQADLRDFGHLKFISQNFDDFPRRNSGISGGYGDGRYQPELRSSPGLWYRLGDGTDSRPYAQEEIRHGTAGAALAFTTRDILAVHPSSPDRSLPTSLVDTAIANGNAELSLWIYRSAPGSSCEIYLSGNAAFEKDVALRIAPQTGTISCIDGTTWRETHETVPVETWTRLSLKLNVDQRTYAAFLNDAEKPLIENISFAPAKDRFVIEHGVNVPIKVPSYRIFNALMVVPTQGEKTPFYLDDVNLTWIPASRFAPHRKHLLASENFESDTPQSPSFANPAFAMENFIVENTTSFGEGSLSARASANASLTLPLSLPENSSSLTIDFDLFLRSEKSFPYILPDPTTKSPHHVRLALGPDESSPLITLDTSEGTWKLGNAGEQSDSSKRIEYDIWNHLQLAIDLKSGKARLTVQPLGALPEPAAEIPLQKFFSLPKQLQLKLLASDTPGHISCLDNFYITAD